MSKTVVGPGLGIIIRAMFISKPNSQPILSVTTIMFTYDNIKKVFI